jgi:SAM-dependent methyltransferase
LDTDVPNAARVYNYWLGGKDNWEVDRRAGDEIAGQLPDLRLMAKANRDFLVRAVETLTGTFGITQFLDIGSGLPSQELRPVHEVAQTIDPAARVVYVDNDELVAAHCRALLRSRSSEGYCGFVLGDIRDPQATILDDPVVRTGLDLRRPVAVLALSVLMYFDDETARHLVSTVMDAVVPGSYLAISYPTGDFDRARTARAIEVAARHGLRYRAASREQVLGLFDGLELVAPGVVPLLQWRPDRNRLHQVDAHRVFYYAGMARKP